SQVGVVVADASTGETVYDHNGNDRAVPASNNKLQTSAAAVGILGEDYTFGTDVASESKPVDGTLADDLYLRGTGDPTMLAEDYDDLAKQLADAGVTTVDGDLVADDTAYDPQPLGAEWGWDDLPYYYAAEISALNVAPDDEFDAGSVQIDVTPGAEGEAAKVKVTPANDYVSIDNQTSTSVAGSDLSISIDRGNGSNEITVSGDIPSDSEGYQDLSSVSGPTGYAADVFGKALADNGITVKGDVRIGETTVDGAKSLAGHESMPLSEMLVPFLKLSNNGHAETLTKAIGVEMAGEGSFEAGTAAIQDFVADLGVDTDQVQQVDGSGMSRQNLIPPAQMVKLLAGAHEADWFKAWYNALPIACQDDQMVGGTLRSRLCDTPAAENLHGKTGSMTSVSALSGYVTDGDGRDLVFSVMNNDFKGDVKDLEDEIAATIAATSESSSISETKIDVPQPGNPAPSDKECS
ncbi:MAG: D-alanyl-D-alanine carboxypeptidase/D-alanyl-D-alanine endopeptidase, partial [Stackebrandtia sp.]